MATVFHVEHRRTRAPLEARRGLGYRFPPPHYFHDEILQVTR